MSVRATTVLFLVLLAGGGCQSSSTTVHPSGRVDVGRLVDRDWQERILSEKYDRARIREAAGEPLIDDGEEWVYAAKFNDGWGIPLDMLLAIYASTNNPTWKLVVVTFDRQGIVERIRIASVQSSIAEYTPRRILFGIYFDREARLRSAPTTQTTRPMGGTE